MGIMHDDGSSFTSYPTSSNLSDVLSSQGYPASTILASNTFPLPDIANSTLAIFNLTTRVATDAQLRCLGQSTAYTGAANRIFDKVYAYEFDRSFQLKGWSPNPPACEALITPDHPFGDPNLPCKLPYSRRENKTTHQVSNRGYPSSPIFKCRLQMPLGRANHRLRHRRPTRQTPPRRL